MKSLDSRVEKLLDAIKMSLWNTNEKKQIVIDRELYQDLKEHSVVLLTAATTPLFPDDDQLKEQWKIVVYSQFMHNEQITYIESQLKKILPCPYVILKGSAAAQYYPNPSYRTMGDIDLIVSPCDYELACQSLLNAAFSEITSKDDIQRGRHRSFSNGAITIEVHLFFASMSDYQKATAFESQIINNINPNQPFLPDLSNGLVLLEHIAQHMHDGIGFRQILDWMMFVDQCIVEEKNWINFCEIAEKAGLERLANVTLQVCHDYLGLPKQYASARKSNQNLCRAMLLYVYDCGNFGNKNKHSMIFCRVVKRLKRQWLLLRLGILKDPKRLVKLNQ